MSTDYYRHDIDGLRAIAIVPVVLFHADVPGLSGGFIGVDIFFVISGFLITSVILREMQDNRPLLVHFYHRRLVRIFPALYVLIAAVLLAGVLLMLPLELADLGRSIAAAVGFVSNIYFWRNADYSGASAETKPLLHTWSLGVEEQFYIFYPLLLVAVCKWYPAWLKRSLFLIMAGSFAIGALAGIGWPEAGFYLLPSRGWELALGGLVAVGTFPRIVSRSTRNVAAVTGGLLLAVGYSVIRLQIGFPVPWALLPCLGTALLIAYGDGTALGQILAGSALRFIGRISYSLYLWHWPVIAFYRLLTGTNLAVLEAAGLVTASFVIAAASFYLIEQPALRTFGGAPSKTVLSMAVSALVGTVACGLLLSVNAEQIGSHPPRVRQIASIEDYRSLPYADYQFRYGSCFQTSALADTTSAAECLRTSKTKINMIIFGDSHAAQYWRAFSLRYPERNVIQATASGCRPVIGGEGKPRCTEVVDYVLSSVLNSGQIDIVVLAARWEANDLPRIKATIDHIRKAGAQVVLVGPSIEYQGSLPALLARAEWYNRSPRTVSELLDPARAEVNAELSYIAETMHVTYIDVQEIICPEDQCFMYEPSGSPMMFDSNHLTFPASRLVVDRMEAL